MEILAKVLKPKGGGGATAGGGRPSSADEEQRFLQSLLALRTRDEIARGTVLSCKTDDLKVEFIPFFFGEDFFEIFFCLFYRFA